MVYLGPETQRMTFVASKFTIVSFLRAFDAVLKK